MVFAFTYHINTALECIHKECLVVDLNSYIKTETAVNRNALLSFQGQKIKLT